MVGEGVFGDVFKARLPAEYGGGEVAVKLSKQQRRVSKLNADAE